MLASALGEVAPGCKLPGVGSSPHWQTERVQLVTSVAIAVARSPMIIANQSSDLHTHSKGRFVVGLGSQVKAHNERRFSVPWIAPAGDRTSY
jgi:alkanesulfonate monooxygenase SsuD/methylene tetrahydromethanopterin reductase-like flavin-dependent oxidoreductase (luciferase family)